MKMNTSMNTFENQLMAVKLVPLKNVWAYSGIGATQSHERDDPIFKSAIKVSP